jgi:hypothetical protein
VHACINFRSKRGFKENKPTPQDTHTHETKVCKINLADRAPRASFTFLLSRTLYSCFDTLSCRRTIGILRRRPLFARLSAARGIESQCPTRCRPRVLHIWMFTRTSNTAAQTYACTAIDRHTRSAAAVTLRTGVEPCPITLNPTRPDLGVAASGVERTTSPGNSGSSENESGDGLRRRPELARFAYSTHWLDLTAHGTTTCMQ